MSDRTHVITVVLDRDYRIEDDVQPILNAIKMTKGVISATPEVVDYDEYMAIERAKYELRCQIGNILKS